MICIVKLLASQSRPHPNAMPPPLPIAKALDASEPLARLTRRLRESKELFAAVEHLLPQTLRQHVHAGPIDDKNWTLLADNSAVAAKLKQLLPTLGSALIETGREAIAIKVRIQSI
jgi:hypothetical protein